MVGQFSIQYIRCKWSTCVGPNLSWHPIFPGGLVLPHIRRPRFKQAPPIPLWKRQTQTYTILLIVISSETKQPAQ